MTFPLLKAAFSAGEISPSMWGRMDIEKWHTACSVARNAFVSYKGGLVSRGGTALVGISRQVAGIASTPPRLIEFRFSITQSYVLEFGDLYMRVIANGAYVTQTAINITGATQANPCVLDIPGNAFAPGDDIFLTGIAGMTPLNGRIVRVRAVAGAFVTIGDAFGNPINSLNFPAYTGAGTAARLFTLTTPYAAADLPYLKYTQSADTMSLCLVNQQTFQDYAPQELVRLAANNWTITPLNLQSSIGPPTGAAVSGTAWSTGPGPAAYGYVVTAVDANTGQESIASNIAAVTGVVDIAGQFGTNTVTWVAPVSGTVSQYNIYRATPDYSNVGVFSGQLFGYVGTTDGALKWQDTNIIADFTRTPPLHNNPFPSSGNFPGVVSYFQQRRAYASTVNEPDTYFLSKTGAYTNFDAGDPPIDSDAITGTPWAFQVNAVQSMTPMPGGLIVGTGQDSWQVSGTGGAGSAITPSQQNAQQQESNGFSPLLAPLKIDYTLLFGQGLGSAIRAYHYNFYFNIYASDDTTVLSSHLFYGRQVTQWAWAREPYKVVWMVRDDGRALSFTFVENENVRAYTRHDTNGLFVSVASASEPPVNAVYWAVKRFIRGQGQWAYFIERMDNRLWNGIEDVWAIDCALRLPQPTPNANLSASAAKGTLGCLAGPVILGGANYSNAVTAVINDPTGQGAVVNSITVAGGAITGYTISPEGAGYTAPQIVFQDTTGSGASAEVIIDNNVTLTTDAPVFSAGSVGSVVRVGGGILTVATFVTPQQVTASVFLPIVATVPNDPNNMPLPAAAGTWTMTAPVTAVTNLNHLEGMTVYGLADGNVVPPTTVVNGTINLPQPASAVTIGLPFIGQAQSMHADAGGKVIQGKRKRIPAVTARFANTRGVKIGQDQPVAAAQPFQAEMPWNVQPNYMTEALFPRNAANAGAAIPMFTGDVYCLIAGDYQTTDGQPSPGMVSVLQDQPLPFELLAFIPDVDLGDKPDAE